MCVLRSEALRWLHEKLWDKTQIIQPLGLFLCILWHKYHCYYLFNGRLRVCSRNITAGVAQGSKLPLVAPSRSSCPACPAPTPCPRRAQPRPVRRAGGYCAGTECSVHWARTFTPARPVLFFFKKQVLIWEMHRPAETATSHGIMMENWEQLKHPANMVKVHSCSESFVQPLKLHFWRILNSVKQSRF